MLLEMVVVGLGLAASGAASLGRPFPDATMALLTALAYVALCGGAALVWGRGVAVWGSRFFAAVAFEDGLGLAGVVWLDQPVRWALVALLTGLVSFAAPRGRRHTARLYRQALYRESIAIGVATPGIALANALTLSTHAALQALTATVGVSGLTLITHGANRRARLLIYAGIGPLEASYMLQLTLFDVGQPQAFVLPAGLYLLLIAYLEWWWVTGDGSRPLLQGAALLLLLGTAVAQSLGYLDAGAGRYVCEVFLLVESVALLGLGVVPHWKRTFFAASVAIVVDAGIMLADPLRAINTWYVMAIVGCAMIALVVVIEQRR